MSTVVDFYLRTTHSSADAEQLFRTHLQAVGADSAGYWIHFRDASAEAQELGRTEYDLEPTVVASVQPPRNHGDGEMDAAMLRTAQAIDAELVALHDDSALFSYRNGVVYAPADDKEFFEEDVAPHFNGRFEWS